MLGQRRDVCHLDTAEVGFYLIALVWKNFAMLPFFFNLFKNFVMFYCVHVFLCVGARVGVWVRMLTFLLHSPEVKQ